MKWAVTGLCLLGIVAALCAAFLISTLRASADIRRPQATTQAVMPEVMVLFATRSIPSMTVIDSSMVATKTVPRDQAPQGFISSPVGVVGKVLATPVREGDPFTASYFSEGTGARQLADVIPKGKRAVGISVTDYAGLEGLLYPGSMVDVLVSFKGQNDGAGNGYRQPITATLLENIQVLAFEHQSVVSPGKASGESDDTMGRNGSARRVTLLVDTKQAKALQLAMEQGTLSLALRNPLDVSSTDGQTISIESLMGPAETHRTETEHPDDPPKWGQALAEAIEAIKKQQAAATQPSTRPAEAEVVKPHWDTTVIHGDSVETLSFPVPPSPELKQAAVRP